MILCRVNISTVPQNMYKRKPLSSTNPGTANDFTPSIKSIKTEKLYEEGNLNEAPANRRAACSNIVPKAPKAPKAPRKTKQDLLRATKSLNFSPITEPNESVVQVQDGDDFDVQGVIEHDITVDGVCGGQVCSKITVNSMLWVPR